MKKGLRQGLAVFALALTARGGLAVLLVLIGLLGVHYDTSSALATLDCDGAVPAVITGGSHGLHRLVVWDSMFFIRVAQCGYEYEQIHAFFPLLPALLHEFTPHGMWDGFLPAAADRLILTGLLLSAISCAASCTILFWLTQAMYSDDRHAALAAMLFCLNPASVFHSAVYTEAIFALLTYSALALLAARPLVGTILMAWATAARSNGIVGGMFVAHRGLRQLYQQTRLTGAALVILETAAGGALVAAPLVAFQVYGHQQFCSSRGPGTDAPGWCGAALPYLYGHVQKHYWGVGFLHYFELKQVANFLLAAPMLSLSAWGCGGFVRQHGVRTVMRELLLPGSALSRQRQRGIKGKGALPLETAIYVVHWGFLTAFALFFMHVQVSTRLLSTCPPLYWFAADLCSGKHARWVWTYFFSYGALGFVLFAQFYPWT